MKFLTLVIAALLLSPMAFAAEPNYKFKGDSQALRVCKAVLSNNPERLDRMLVSYHQQNRTLAHYLPKHDQAILEDFTCNDMSLYDFSINVGANDVNRYIRDYKQGQPRVYVEDVAGNPEPAPAKYYF